MRALDSVTCAAAARAVSRRAAAGEEAFAGLGDGPLPGALDVLAERSWGAPYVEAAYTDRYAGLDPDEIAADGLSAHLAHAWRVLVLALELPGPDSLPYKRPARAVTGQAVRLADQARAGRVRSFIPTAY